MSQVAIEINAVSKRFGETDVVKSVSLVIKEGEFFSLLGPSGCGKTTLLRMIAGFETPSSGQIIIAGRDMSSVPPHERPVNMVFQSYALFPHLTVFDNVAFGLKCKKQCPQSEIPGKVQAALELVRLWDFAQRYPAQLSGGQQQRVALARAIVNQPAVVLLDEPLSALDLKIRQQMQDELAGLKRKLKTTFVMVTHDQGEALALSDRIAVFYKGSLDQLGTPREIYENPATPFVASFIGQTNLIEVKFVEQLADRAVVALPDQTKVTVRNNPHMDQVRSNLTTGRSVLLWVRMDSLRLLAADATGDPSIHEPTHDMNNFPATVVGLSYQGATTEYSLQLGDLNLKATCNNDGQKIFELGQAVRVEFPWQSASILPRFDQTEPSPFDSLLTVR